MSQFLEAVGFGVLNDVLSMFRSNEGYAHPNRYEVVISGPSGGGQSFANIANLKKGSTRGSNTRNISLRCESVSLPGRNLATSTDANIYGPTREVVEGVTYAEDITMVFQSSSDLKERVFFESWQEQAFNDKSWNVQYYNDYVGTVDIYLLDRESNRRYGLRLMEAFPKTVNAIELSYGSTNEIVKTSVGMAFRYWESLDIERKGPNILGRITETVLGTVERKLNNNIPSSVRRLF
tara:strand:+ start:4999 stop:5706 length:708 start_codon:yes stop_codon:yes gene_type:complete